MEMEQRKYFAKRIEEVYNDKHFFFGMRMNTLYSTCLKDLMDIFIFKYGEQIKVTLQMFAEKPVAELVDIMTDDKLITDAVTEPNHDKICCETYYVYDRPFCRLINMIEKVGVHSFKAEIDPIFKALNESFTAINKQGTEKLNKLKSKLTDRTYDDNFGNGNDGDFICTSEKLFDTIIEEHIDKFKEEHAAIRKQLN